jgi:hypothetical protein
VSYFAAMFGDQVKIPFKRKNRPFVAFVVFIFVMVSCGPEKTPEGILSEQQMVKVLSEIYIAEDKAGRMGITRDSVVKIFPQFEAKVFKEEGLSDSVFRKSMEYYKANPKKLENIYAALVDSLSLRAQRMPGTTPIQ